MHSFSPAKAPTLYPEALRLTAKCLRAAREDWDYLSSIGGDGPVAEIEKYFARMNRVRYAIAMSSGTSAIESAILASGIGPGDEVILPAYTTWPAILTPVLLAGATPVFADIERDSVTISPAAVAKLVTRKTKAILAIHLHGYPADMQALESIAKRAGCALICDAAQALGTQIGGKSVATCGDYVAFSLGRGKLVSAGEGGILACRDRSLFERAIAVSQHPLRVHRDVDNPEVRLLYDGIGTNARMHPMLAALALGQLVGATRSRVLARSRTRYRRVASKLRRSGLGRLIPSLPPGAEPNGTSFPLRALSDSDRTRVERSLRRAGFEIDYAGASTPLYLLASMAQHRAFSYGSAAGITVARHESHQKGSCPNAEERCRDPQWLLRLTNEG